MSFIERIECYIYNIVTFGNLILIALKEFCDYLWVLVAKGYLGYFASESTYITDIVTARNSFYEISGLGHFAHRSVNYVIRFDKQVKKI